MIRLENVDKRYPSGEHAVRDVSLDIGDGEFVVLVGPSGSGKSTLLKMVAGLTSVSAGRIVIGGRDVTEVPPQDRDVAMVFQSYALYPHMTVRDNLEFGLRMRRTPRQERRERANEVARMLGIEDLLDRRPAALSGGQRQRVAMGRAVVRRPSAYLMDEPLSNLDAKLRVHVRAELVQLRDRLRTTTLYVTHDQVEAMTLGERVAVLHTGVLQQVDSPRALYERPANAFVGGFIGSPRMNIYRGRLSADRVTLGPQSIPIRIGPALSKLRDRDLLVGIRPSSFAASDYSPEREWPRIDALPRAVEDLGSEKIVVFELEDASGALLDFQARVDPRADVRAGQLARLAVDPGGLYFFDLQSEETLAFPVSMPTSVAAQA